MNLQEKAEYTLNLEYPGRTLDAAQDEANQRAYDAINEVWRLRDQLNYIQYCIDHAERDYHEAVRAANLFENALIEQEEAV